MFEQIENIVLNHMYGESEEGVQIILTRLNDDVIMGAVSIVLEPGVLEEHARVLSLYTLPNNQDFVRWTLQQFNKISHLKNGNRFVSPSFQMTALVQFDATLSDFRVIGTSTDTKGALKLLIEELYVLCREDRDNLACRIVQELKSGTYTYVEGAGVKNYADLFLS
jgi:hypothetical protein